MAIYGSVYSLAHAAAAGTDPTTAAEGQALNGLKGVTVIVEAEATRTLSGAGSLLCWVYDGSAGAPAVWCRCPGLDLSVTLSGKRQMAFPAAEVLTPRNSRITWVPSGVTISGGTNVTVYQLGHMVGGVY